MKKIITGILLTTIIFSLSACRRAPQEMAEVTTIAETTAETTVETTTEAIAETTAKATATTKKSNAAKKATTTTATTTRATVTVKPRTKAPIPDKEPINLDDEQKNNSGN